MYFRNLNSRQFKTEIETKKNIIILDVRTPSETAQGMLKGAEAVDFLSGNFADKLSTFDKSKSYFLYCRSGNRSGQACQIMVQMGFVDVANLDGGMLAWVS